jgi:YihY family inner membrane protein
MVGQIKATFQSAVEVLSRNMAKISVFSFLTLLFIAGRMFKTIEDCFNIIWRVELGRSLFMKAALTTALIFWGPVFIALSVTFSEKVSTDWPAINRYIVPWFLTGVGFTAFYMIMPHVRVEFKKAVLGGFAGALLWELSKYGFLLYCTHALGGSYRIYGTLGLIPVVFLWVNISWTVVLIGAEITYILQHRRAVEERWTKHQAELLASKSKHAIEDQAYANAALLPYVTMAAAIETARMFRIGKVAGGVRKAELLAALDVEPTVLDRAIERLIGAGVLVLVADNHKNVMDDPRFLPGRDLSLIDLAKLAEVSKGPMPTLAKGLAWEKSAEILKRYEREGEGPLSHETLAELFTVESKLKEASIKEGGDGEKPAIA